MILCFVVFGSLWALIVDIRRIRHAEQHIIIITPSDFVKQDGQKIIHVPLEHVRHVTARGTPPVDRSLEGARADTQTSSLGENFASMSCEQHDWRKQC